MEADIDASGIRNGRIGGAIRDEDVRATVIPALASSVQATIDAECSSAPPSCCPGGSNGDAYLQLFDTDANCTITAAEIENNALIGARFAPDLDLIDATRDNAFAPRVDGVNDALSIAIGFTAVGARFERPRD